MALIRYSSDKYEFTIQEYIIVTILTIVLSALSYYLIEKKLRRVPTKSFIIVFFPSVISLLLFSFFIPKIFIVKKIDEKYLSSIIGYDAFKNGYIQKLGLPNQKEEVLLLGNSHALNFNPVIDKLAKENHYSANSICIPGIPPIPGMEKIVESNNTNKKMALKLIPQSDSLIKTSKVILFIAQIKDQSSELVYKSLEDLCSKLNNNQTLILITSFPTLDKNPVKFNKDYIKRSEHKYTKFIDQKTNNFYLALSNKYDNVKTYNISELEIWDDAPFINDTLAYYDSIHMNYFGAEKLSEYIGEDFGKLIDSLLKEKKVTE